MLTLIASLVQAKALRMELTYVPLTKEWWLVLGSKRGDQALTVALSPDQLRDLRRFLRGKLPTPAEATPLYWRTGPGSAPAVAPKANPV